jgi:hypothetical protein
LDKARSLSAGGPLGLGFPLKMTVSPDKTFFTTALLTILFIFSKKKEGRKERKKDMARDYKVIKSSQKYTLRYLKR